MEKILEVLLADSLNPAASVPWLTVSHAFPRCYHSYGMIAP